MACTGGGFLETNQHVRTRLHRQAHVHTHGPPTGLGKLEREAEAGCRYSPSASQNHPLVVFCIGVLDQFSSLPESQECLLVWSSRSINLDLSQGNPF